MSHAAIPDSAGARRHAVVAGIIWLLLSAALVTLALILPIQPVAASREAGVIDRTFLVLLVVSIPVFALVEVVVVYSALRFRAVADEDGPPIASRRAISVGWVTTTTGMVLALAAFGWAGMNDVLHGPHEHPDLVVRVDGKQFGWTFDYPSLGVSSTTLRVPKDRLVRFELSSEDVLHSFWVPAFRVKQDIVPGRVIAVSATATEVGTYQILCAELCGLGHTYMRAPVEVMDQVAFDHWASDAKARAR